MFERFVAKVGGDRRGLALLKERDEIQNTALMGRQRDML
jgi:hypothetical protein